MRTAYDNQLIADLYEALQAERKPHKNPGAERSAMASTDECIAKISRRLDEKIEPATDPHQIKPTRPGGQGASPFPPGYQPGVIDSGKGGAYIGGVTVRIDTEVGPNLAALLPLFSEEQFQREAHRRGLHS